MNRIAFKMKIKSGCEAEYKKRHTEIWPELKRLLSETGVSDYSIYLDEDSRTLFAFQRVKKGFDKNILPNHPLMKKWWDYMSDISEINPDNSPQVTLLNEVFHMD